MYAHMVSSDPVFPPAAQEMAIALAEQRVRSTFSNAFKTGALYTMPKSSIIFNIFMNIGLYILFTGLCFCFARPPHNLVKKAIGSRLARVSVPGPVRCFITPKQMSKEQAVAVCFCGAAKTTGVGIPLVAASK